MKIMQISAKSSKDTLNIKAPQIYLINNDYVHI
mgnify:FL=1